MLRPPKSLLLLPAICVSAALVAALSGCASQSAGGPVAITKVNPVHLSSSQTVKTEDNMLDFEGRRALWGHVEQAERRERFGNYLTVFWKTSTKRPATVRLDYRQGATGPRVHAKEVHVASPKSRNTTKFEIIGDEYHSQGRVTQWKASIIEDGQTVAEYRSFLWND